jgi:hypothetical protein
MNRVWLWCYRLMTPWRGLTGFQRRMWYLKKVTRVKLPKRNR